MLFFSFSSHLCLLTDGFNFFFFFVKDQYRGLFTSLCPAWLFSSADAVVAVPRAQWQVTLLRSLSPPAALGQGPQVKGKLQPLLLAVSTLDEPVGLLDGRLVHEHGVLGVAGLQRVVLLVLVSCRGARQGHR